MSTTAPRTLTSYYGPRTVEYVATGDVADGTDGFTLLVDGAEQATNLTWRELLREAKAL